MNYISTRDKSCEKSAGEAILQGISEDGGLFVPHELPALSRQELTRLCGLDYLSIAQAVFAKYLTDFSEAELRDIVNAAYTGEKFENDLPAPLARVGDGPYLLELWHGPTCAFKDMALQALPRFMHTAAEHLLVSDEIVILVATSGDTGKAALEGFRDAKGTRIVVFYPEDGVSEMQKLQMKTQEGENVLVCAIKGNFDDAQSAVKEIFSDASVRERLSARGMRFSSANSINFGRLLPQVVYYVSAYCDLVNDEEIAFGDEVNVVVPTGNFGNILAAYYAKRMGLPIKKLICASNSNNVLTDFIKTGVYDSNREFYKTDSPSMDILISSNLERLLFELSDRDDGAITAAMSALAESGRYSISEVIHRALVSEFEAGFCDDEKTEETICSVFERCGYVLDPHTAVAFAVYEQYREQSGDDTPAIVVSTASPHKFADSVCRALHVSHGDGPFAAASALRECSGLAAPAPIAALSDKKSRFSDVCERGQICEYLCEKLGI